VPFSVDVCGLPKALSLASSVPVLAPVSDGVNTTLTVHVNWAPRLVVHVVEEMLKSPVADSEIPVRATFCRFFSVKVKAGLLVPTFSVGKA
jgi:hypothetical protein